MLHFVSDIIEVKPYTVVCRFNNEEVRAVDLWPLLEKNRVDGNVYAQLLDTNYFKTVQLDSYGTLTWDNEVDFCPDVLYDMSVPV